MDSNQDQRGTSQDKQEYTNSQDQQEEEDFESGEYDMEEDADMDDFVEEPQQTAGSQAMLSGQSGSGGGGPSSFKISIPMFGAGAQNALRPTQQPQAVQNTPDMVPTSQQEQPGTSGKIKISLGGISTNFNQPAPVQTHQVQSVHPAIISEPQKISEPQPYHPILVTEQSKPIKIVLGGMRPTFQPSQMQAISQNNIAISQAAPNQPPQSQFALPMTSSLPTQQTQQLEAPLYPTISHPQMQQEYLPYQQSYQPSTKQQEQQNVSYQGYPQPTNVPLANIDHQMMQQQQPKQILAAPQSQQPELQQQPPYQSQQISQPTALPAYTQQQHHYIPQQHPQYLNSYDGGLHSSQQQYHPQVLSFPTVPALQLVAPDTSVSLAQPPLFTSAVQEEALPVQDTQDDFMTPQQPPQAKAPLPKPQKEKKKKKVKLYGDLLEYYDLIKVKVTMEFNPVEYRARGQTLYRFQIRNKETAGKRLQELAASEMYKKCLLDLKFNAKQMQISSVALVSTTRDGDLQRGEKKLHELAFSYSDPKEQVQFQKERFERISHDIGSYEAIERREYERQAVEGQMLAKNVVSVNFKKEDLIGQLPDFIDIAVRYFLNHMRDFGIRGIKYRSQDSGGTYEEDASESECTYFVTQDGFDSQSLWMPVVTNTYSIPLNWSFKYIVPLDYTVVASGNLHIKQIEGDGSDPRALFHFKLKDQESAPAFKLGFLIAKFSHIHKLSDMQGISSAHAFFISPDKYSTFTQHNFYEKNIFNILHQLQHKLVNAPYPFSSLKLVFVPNLFLSKSRKQSLDFTGGLHILDEELLFIRGQQEGRHRTYKYLSSSLAFDFFGGRVYEETPDDHWLLVGIRESIGNHFKILKFGTLLHRYHIMQTIESVYQKMKHGFERYPVDSLDVPNPNEFLLSDLLYEKSELIMHMIESMIQTFFFKIVKELYSQGNPTVSQRLFLRIFKQVCGFKLKQFANNWFHSTSCPKLAVSYIYNKKNNSLDLTLTQESAVKDHYVFQKYLQQNAQLGELLTKPFLREDTLWLSNEKTLLKQGPLKAIEAMGKFMVELKQNAQKWFQGEVNVMLYLTDGAEITAQQQKMSLKWGEREVSINIPLNVKVKKTIQNKKKDFDTLHIHEHDDDEDMENDKQKQQQNAGGSTTHLIDNNHWKFGMNEYELEDYPLQTKDIFDVKNLESSVLWIRVDPDMEYIRKVSVSQDSSNWLFQLLLEKDIIGQIEAIKQIYKLKQSPHPPALAPQLPSSLAPGGVSNPIVPQANAGGSQHPKEFLYQILQAVCTNENYFFKVRKVALRYLQKIQTSAFNKFLSHEKFLIKIFNQRNFDPSIGFYRANDFSRQPLEYYFDKYLLKTLSKCKESPLILKQEVIEMIANFKKQTQPQQAQVAAIEGGSISIPLLISQPTVTTKVEKAPREAMLKVSSDAIASLFLKLLQENDNSENPLDDSHYLSQLLKSMGRLDSFKHLPALAREVYRQFKLDHIGRRFSPQFVITKGSISAFFGLKKQIHLFKEVKSQNIDALMMEEDLAFINEQINNAQNDVLSQMEIEVDAILNSPIWPLEVRMHIAGYKIKHCFLYQNNNFLKALYIQLKIIDNLQSGQKLRDALEYTKQLSLFLDSYIKRLDFREALLDSERSRAIVSIFWSLLSVPAFHYLDDSMSFWLKRIFATLYGTGVPRAIVNWQEQEGIKPEEVKFDEQWMTDEGQEEAIRELQAKNTRQKQQMLKSQQQIGFKKIETGLVPERPIVQGMDKLDTKLKIVLPVLQKSESSFSKQNHQPATFSEQPGSSIKISIGGLPLDQFKHQQVQPIKSSSQSGFSISIPTAFNKNQPSRAPVTFESEQLQQLKLMQSLSNEGQAVSGGNRHLNDYSSLSNAYPGDRRGNIMSNMKMNEQDGEPSESVYDEFAEIQFEVDWVQKIWDITGHLWYHEESQAFVQPVSRNDLGDYFDYYLSIIEYPMDLETMKSKIKAGQYASVALWRQDVEVMFRNCKKFNEETSEIHKSAVKLGRFFYQELKDYGLMEQKQLAPTNSSSSSVIRIR